jgi:hypothetical protein
MALAQIIDLDDVRRARRASTESMMMPASAPLESMWCFVWMPVYYWYVG